MRALSTNYHENVSDGFMSGTLLQNDVYRHHGGDDTVHA